MGRDAGSDGERDRAAAEVGTAGPDQAHLRAGDADRQRVADRLRRAVDEGRLTVFEYDERLAAAYAARTYGELTKVTADLPEDVAPVLSAPEQPEPPARRGPRRALLLRQARGWLGGAVITNGIWAVTSGFDWHHYWPGVVLPIWAVAIVGGAISRSGAPDQDPDHPDREADPRQDRTSPGSRRNPDHHLNHRMDRRRARLDRRRDR